MSYGPRAIKRDTLTHLFTVRVTIVSADPERAPFSYEHGPYFAKGQAKARLKRELRLNGTRVGVILSAPVGEWSVEPS